MFTKKSVYNFFTLITILVMLALSLMGCAGKTSAPNDEVTVQLSWFHTVEFAGFYAADKQGYYAEENIAVKLLPGGFDILPWKDVAEGKADFGVTGGNSLMTARAEGLPIKAIGAIFRKSPVALMSLAKLGIKTPQDMIGKRVGIISPSLDDTNDIQFLSMLKKLGIDRSEMELVPIEDYSVGSLTSGAMDVSSVFSTNEPIDAKQKGIDVNLIFPQDYGVLMYANVIFTTDQMIKEKPELVERFMRATLKGYKYAIEHPDDVSKLALQYDNTLNLEFQQATMKVEIPLIDTGSAPIGTMDTDVWQSTLDILLEQGFLKSTMDLNEVYTNDFITK
jgi:NitT/TauT family transport system substrate-binding protein